MAEKAAGLEQLGALDDGLEQLGALGDEEAVVVVAEVLNVGLVLVMLVQLLVDVLALGAEVVVVVIGG